MMKKAVLFVVVISIFLAFQMYAHAQRRSMRSMKTKAHVDFPEVPRISADEAYGYYKAGKAILIQASGRVTYERRHILGAINYDSEDVRSGKVKLPRLPKRGKLIITYCY